MSPKKEEKKEEEKKSPPTRSASPSDDHAHHKKTHPRSKDDKDKDHGSSKRHQTGKGKARQLEYKHGGKVKHTGSAKLHKGEVVLPKAVVDKMKKLFL